MPVSELELDNVSPLLQYTGPWRAGRTDDEFYDLYSNGGTFAVTNSNDAKVSISFSGTGVTVYGAKRPNHNKYTVTLDGNKLPLDGFSEVPVWDQPLYMVSNLRDGSHTLVIQNDSDNADPEMSYLDIDSVLLETTMETTRSGKVHDYEVTWQYAPSPSQWTANVGDLETSPGSDESSHVTAAAGASATLYFVGSGIDLYGIVCRQCGDYAVQIDDDAEAVLNAGNADHSVDNQILYYARGLEDKLHRIRITNRGSEGTLMGVDHAIVYGQTPGAVTPPPETPTDPVGDTPATGAGGAPAGPSSTGLPQNSPSDLPPPTSSNKRLPIAEIVCGVLAGLLLLLGLFVFFLLRQRKRRGRRPGPVGGWRESIIPTSPISPTAVASPFRMSMQQLPPTLSTPSASSVSRSNTNSSSHPYSYSNSTNSSHQYSNSMSLSVPPPPSRSVSSRSVGATTSENPFDDGVAGVRVTMYGSDTTSETGGGLAYDQQTLLQSPPRAAFSVRSPSPAPALVLHEAPPAYDLESRPSSIVVGDRKV